MLPLHQFNGRTSCTTGERSQIKTRLEAVRRPLQAISQCFFLQQAAVYGSLMRWMRLPSGQPEGLKRTPFFVFFKNSVVP
jgi:hypothetical protein